MRIVYILLAGFVMLSIADYVTLPIVFKTTSGEVLCAVDHKGNPMSMESVRNSNFGRYSTEYAPKCPYKK